MLYLLNMKLIIFCSLILISFKTFSKSDPVLNKAPSLKKVIHKYVSNKGVRMNFQRTLELKLLKKTKKTRGKITLSKSSISLQLEDTLKTRIVFSGDNLWYITSPAGQKKKIVKINLKEKDQDKNFLSLLFNSESLFQKFRFISSRQKGRTWILNFEASQPSVEISSFSVKIDGKLLLKAWLRWREFGDKEEYTFSNIQFNQEIPSNFFHIN